MECNRDEAIRAKAIAEEKLEKKDFSGAKKFALKAQSLYPGLEGVSQILTTLDVYIAAENKVSGEVDWYGVLGVSPSADDETVRKQYRKLALMLHPDKNKSVGADGAFKLLSEAWILLSDKAKRLAYNQRRSLGGSQLKASNQGAAHSGPPQANGYHNSTSRANPAPNTPSSTARPPPSSVPPLSSQRTDTFWTICHRCKMHYEYLKVYLNHTLLCPNCHGAFVAAETPPPQFNHSRQTGTAPRQRHQNLNTHVRSNTVFGSEGNAAGTDPAGRGQAGASSFHYGNFHRDPPSRTTGTGNADHSIAAKAANVVLQAHERMKRERDGAQAAGSWEGSRRFTSDLRGEMPQKKSRLDNGYNHQGMSAAHHMSMGNGSYGVPSTSGSRKWENESAGACSFANSFGKPNGMKEPALSEVRNMLTRKAQKEVLKKLGDMKSVAVNKSANADKENSKVSKKVKERSSIKVQGHGDGSIVAGQPKKTSAGAANKADKQDNAVASMNVPDPDFHDFDLDRAESSFGDNEVWSAYDDDDGMPRFYAIIHKVLSRKPFKVKLSWLNSKSNSEFGDIDWTGSGFYKTCGEFRIGKHENCKSINSFSHKVKWSKGERGVIQIFPGKGDVWALYRNWSPDWNEHTEDEVIHQYDMVMLLDDYREQQGVSVTPLVKVPGFKTVFRPHPDPEKVWWIPKEEMFRLSHRVPSYLLSGEEARNAPKGCLELDPAATPLDLLQILTEANEVPMMQNGVDTKDEVLQRVSEREVNGIGDDKLTQSGDEEMVVNSEAKTKGKQMGIPE